MEDGASSLAAVSMRGRVSYPRASEEQDQLSTALRIQYVWFLLSRVVTQAIDINITPDVAGTWTQACHWKHLRPRCHHGTSGSTDHPDG